jgi:hypothetical protein
MSEKEIIKYIVCLAKYIDELYPDKRFPIKESDKRSFVKEVLKIKERCKNEYLHGYNMNESIFEYYLGIVDAFTKSLHDDYVDKKWNEMDYKYLIYEFYSKLSVLNEVMFLSERICRREFFIDASNKTQNAIDSDSERIKFLLNNVNKDGKL